MQAKQNSGFFIGPLYYYFVAIFYFFTKLDPVASGIIAGVSSMISFSVIYIFIRKLFSWQMAAIAGFLHAFSLYIINLDRIQWPVNLIAPISIVIFYLLYKITTGKERYLPLLATAVGFSLHLNFTSIFFPLIVLLVIPFFPRRKSTLKYFIISVPLFLVWLIPNFLAEFQSQNVHTHNLFLYVKDYYHGLHLTRVMQLAKDAFIEFDGMLINNIKPLKYVLLPCFVLIYYLERPSHKRLIFCYLVTLWFVVPWLVFSLYSGEISNYYFSITRPTVLLITSYIILRLYQQRYLLVKFALSLFLIYFSVNNVRAFSRERYLGLSDQRQEVIETISKGKKIEFQQGIPASYLYYLYKEHDSKK